MTVNLLRKFCLAVSACLLLTGLAACAVPFQPAATPVPATVPAAPLVTVTLAAGTEIGRQPAYTIATEMPALEGAPAAQAAVFDADLAGVIQSQVADFKKSVRENASAAAIVGGSSYFDQRLGLVSFVGQTVSLKLVTEAYIASSAHPYHLSVSYTFDLAAGKTLSLDGLFLPGASYLQAIADDCRAQLAARQMAEDIFAQGADPTPENYRVWNLTADGLLITFNEYQVAPYASGPQTVVVPYTRLKTLIDPHGPLATFAP